MRTKTLSTPALKIIDGYTHIRIGSAVAGTPYFNNKTVGARFSERVRVGKGSPSDIEDELKVMLIKEHIAMDSLADETLEKLLADRNLGIDCSGFVYHTLDAENKARGHGHLNRRLTFVKGGNPVTKMLSYLRPAQNCDVRTFASELNSRIVPLTEVQPGDFITMIGTTGSGDRNHIVLVTEINLDGDEVKSFSYIHTIAYPEDGLYGTGVRRGKISITYPTESLAKQVWTEEGSADKARDLYERVTSSKTELRRLKWLT